MDNETNKEKWLHAPGYVKRAEAQHRMYDFGFSCGIIRDFKENGTIYCSENTSSDDKNPDVRVYKVEDPEILDAVKAFEEEKDAIVYYVLKENSEKRDTLAFVSVPYPMQMWWAEALDRTWTDDDHRVSLISVHYVDVMKKTWERENIYVKPANGGLYRDRLEERF